MTWVLAVIVVLILGGAAVVGSGRWGAMPELVDDRPGRLPPPGPITAEDLATVRFDVVARGYSMEQVDELVERLRAQLPSGTVAPDADVAQPDARP